MHMKSKTYFQLCIFIFLLLQFSVFASTASHQVPFSEQELKNIQGHYSTVEGYIFIRVKRKQVSTNYKGKYIQLIKKSDGHIYPIYRFLKIFPIDLGEFSFSLRVNQGKKQLLIHRNNKKTEVVAQQFKTKAIPKRWKERLGKYKTTLLKGKSRIKRIALRIKNGVLVAYINSDENPYPLLALSSSQIVTPATGYRKIQQINITFQPNKNTLMYGNNTLLVIKHKA